MLVVFAAASAAGLLIASKQDPAVLVGGIVAVVAAILFLRFILDRLEWGLLVLIFLTYTNFSDVLIKNHGVPSFTKALAPILGLLIIYRWIAANERPVNITQAALGVVLFGIVSSLSIFHVDHVDRTIDALELYAKDALLALVTVLLIRGGDVLRRVVWSILVGILFLGSIGVFKYLSGDLENDFWGFAQASYSHIAGELDSHRLSGPMADPNHYAALLVLAMPLALDRMLHEQRWLMKMLAGAAMVLGLACIGLTASRGAFLALGLVAGLALVLFRPRFWYLIPLALPTMLLALPLFPDEYVARYQAIFDLIPGFGNRAGGTEVSIRGRLGEWAAAWAMFLDHPILGIGLAQYEPNFETYTLRLGTPLRGGMRQAHSLYLEIAAERGLVGLCSFFALLGLALVNVCKARRHAYRVGNPDVARIATSFGMATLALLTAMIFLHDAYPRMLWLALVICLAMPSIVRYDGRIESVSNLTRRGAGLPKGGAKLAPNIPNG